MCNTSLLVSQMVSSILPWNLWQKARAAEEQVSFSCNAAADEMPFQDTASVPAVFRPCVRKGRGGGGLPAPQPAVGLSAPATLLLSHAETGARLWGRSWLEAAHAGCEYVLEGGYNQHAECARAVQCYHWLVWSSRAIW